MGPGSDAQPSAATAAHERLGAADEVNLDLDHGDSVYVVTVVGSLGAGGFVDGSGGIDLEALRGTLAERIAHVPRLRGRVEGTPGRHLLVEADVDIRAHVRLAEPVERWAGFEELCARISATRLARDRPLWELLIVPNTDPRVRVGWVFRVHHALADGVTAARMLDALFDPEPGSGEPERVSAPAMSRSGYWSGLMRALARRLPPTALLGRLGHGRGLRLFDASLASLARHARAARATVNDVVLAAAGAGAREAYAQANEAVPVELPVSVPVLLPAAGGLANQVSAVVVSVPLDEIGIEERLRAVSATTRTAMEQTRARPLPWFARTRAGGRVMGWFNRHQRMIGLLSTNVRGPAHARRLCGAPVETAWALPVLAGNVRVAIGALSYAGRMSFSVLWSDALGETGEAFARGMQAAIAELEHTDGRRR